MTHPKTVGDKAALAVMIGLHEAGISFLLPFAENAPYDFGIEIDGRLARVQCKSGRLRNGAVRFSTCSWYSHHPNPKQTSRDYLGDVDYFAVYCSETEAVYLIPIDDLQTRRMGALRVETPRNGQRRRIRFAANYEIAKVSAVKS
jgi:hypothetical protein